MTIEKALQRLKDNRADSNRNVKAFCIDQDPKASEPDERKEAEFLEEQGVLDYVRSGYARRIHVTFKYKLYRLKYVK